MKLKFVRSIGTAYIDNSLINTKFIIKTSTMILYSRLNIIFLYVCEG